MAIQITQIARAEAVKNSSVNQSIKAPTLRRSVGRAKAASAARAGRPSSNARSAGWVVMVAPMDTRVNQRGTSRCRWPGRLKICWRQRHNVHRASGQAGQPNHSSRRARLSQSLPPPSNPTTRQRHRSRPWARAAAASVAAASTAAQRQRRSVLPAGANSASNAPPMPNNVVSAGAPDSVSPAMPSTNATAGATVRCGMAATAKNSKAVQPSCAR